MKTKAFLLTIVVIFSVFTINSCKKEPKNREYDEAEVVVAAKDLIKKSEILNEIYYGHGIECDLTDVSNANGNYYPADLLSTKKFGVETIEDIKALTRECFTQSLSNLMISTVLMPITDDDGNIIKLARYYQEYDALDTTLEKCIMVNSEYSSEDKILFKDDVEYFYDTVRVSHAEGEKIIVKIDVKVTNSSGNVKEDVLEVELLEEKNGFRLDTFTFINNFQPPQ